MYNWNDILIVGDSWCAERNHPAYWPNRLLLELTDIAEGIPRGRGFSGCHWWSARNNLFRELNSKLAKVIVIIHTDHSRIPSDEDKPFTTSILTKNINTKYYENRLIYSAVAYYKHLYSDDFHKWCEKQWFLELDNFLQEKQIEKVIHLSGINKPRNQKYVFKHGVTVDISLHRYLTYNTETKYYPNHMTLENNEKLALFLHELIENYPGHGHLYTKLPF